MVKLKIYKNIDYFLIVSLSGVILYDLLFISFFIGKLLILHSWLLFKNLTFYEYYKKKVHKLPISNPFDKGKCYSFKNVILGIILQSKLFNFLKNNLNNKNIQETDNDIENDNNNKQTSNNEEINEEIVKEIITYNNNYNIDSHNLGKNINNNNYNNSNRGINEFFNSKEKIIFEYIHGQKNKNNNCINKNTKNNKNSDNHKLNNFNLNHKTQKNLNQRNFNIILDNSKKTLSSGLSGNIKLNYNKNNNNNNSSTIRDIESNNNLNIINNINNFDDININDKVLNFNEINNNIYKSNNENKGNKLFFLQDSGKIDNLNSSSKKFENPFDCCNLKKNSFNLLLKKKSRHKYIINGNMLQISNAKINEITNINEVLIDPNVINIGNKGINNTKLTKIQIVKPIDGDDVEISQDKSNNIIDNSNNNFQISGISDIKKNKKNDLHNSKNNNKNEEKVENF